jgi:phosphatidylglycerophosphatase C
MSLALFDFDGTITTHGTMPDFVRRSVKRRRLLFGQFLLAPLVIGYKLGLVSGVMVRRAIVRYGYTGHSLAALEAAGHEFARDYLPNVLRQEAMQRIAWHKAQGHKVVVVSGGLDVYLTPWCREHGLELICSSLQHHQGVLTGRYLGRQCVLAEKPRRVRERYDLDSYSSVYAYGDTPEDHDLLGIATKRYYRWQEIGAAVGR